MKKSNAGPRSGKLERGGSIQYRDEKPKENQLPNR